MASNRNQNLEDTNMISPATLTSCDVNLHDFDVVLINSSAGKDSQTMMDVVVELARTQNYPLDRVHVVHADLGRVEWDGTKELAAQQAAIYGLTFHVVAKIDTKVAPFDLLKRILVRGAFPDYARRWCTSDHKRSPIKKLYTALAKQYRTRGRATRILSCLGMRAEESTSRAKRPTLRASVTTKNQAVTEWLPIHHYTTDQVWMRIRQSGVPHHPAYDAGMPRLSCSFCPLASKGALVRAAQLRPELAAEYAQVEQQIGHDFKADLSMAEIIEEAKTAPIPAQIDALTCDGMAGMVEGWAA